MPSATPFLRRRVLDGLPVDRLNGLWTRGFNEYYRKNIATSSIRPLLHVIALYSVTGYTMSHAVKHSQPPSSTQLTPDHPMSLLSAVDVLCSRACVVLTCLLSPLLSHLPCCRLHHHPRVSLSCLSCALDSITHSAHSHTQSSR